MRMPRQNHFSREILFMIPIPNVIIMGKAMETVAVIMGKVTGTVVAITEYTV